MLTGYVSFYLQVRNILKRNPSIIGVHVDLNLDLKLRYCITLPTTDQRTDHYGSRKSPPRKSPPPRKTSPWKYPPRKSPPRKSPPWGLGY